MGCEMVPQFLICIFLIIYGVEFMRPFFVFPLLVKCLFISFIHLKNWFVCLKSLSFQDRSWHDRFLLQPLVTQWLGIASKWPMENEAENTGTLS